VQRLSAPLRRHQQYTRETATRADRYPLVFQFLRCQLSDRKGLRLLSFGCSSGEEVFTLRRYFPDAAIKGIDVNPRQIAQARRLSNDPRVTFAVAGSAVGEASARYDAILCMAVFRDPTLDLAATRRADGPVTFAAFERELSELVRSLKPGGLLFVAHSNFRVADTSAAALLEPVLHSDPPRSGLAPGLYGADGERIDDALDRVVGYRKRDRTAP
jgi:SAM-dependent methyltransferase